MSMKTVLDTSTSTRVNAVEDLGFNVLIWLLGDAPFREDHRHLAGILTSFWSTGPSDSPIYSDGWVAGKVRIAGTSRRRPAGSRELVFRGSAAVFRDGYRFHDAS
jgi:hypothetical protein